VDDLTWVGVSDTKPVPKLLPLKHTHVRLAAQYLCRLACMPLVQLHCLLGSCNLRAWHTCCLDFCGNREHDAHEPPDMHLTNFNWQCQSYTSTPGRDILSTPPNVLTQLAVLAQSTLTQQFS